MAEWEGNVQEMRDFIEARCAYVMQAAIDCYQPEISGPYLLTIDVEPAGAGRVKLNTFWHETFPWTGSYFGSMENLLEAEPYSSNPNMVFSHWETSSGSIIGPSIDSAEASVIIANDDTITAVFQNTVDIQEPDAGEISVLAYPNPTSERFTINMTLPTETDFTISLYSAEGKMVHTESGSGATYFRWIDVSNLSNGVYQLTVDSEHGRVNKRLTISH